MSAKRVLVVACLLLAACKQGIGSRCQVASDCDDGLVCNVAKNTCQTSEGGDLDASVPDGPPRMDAAVDAPDAMVGSGAP